MKTSNVTLDGQILSGKLCFFDAGLHRNIRNILHMALSAAAWGHRRGGDRRQTDCCGVAEAADRSLCAQHRAGVGLQRAAGILQSS